MNAWLSKEIGSIQFITHEKVPKKMKILFRTQGLLKDLEACGDE